VAALPRPFVPSGGRDARRRVRLLAVLAERDEMRFLPGFVRNVGPQVDGIVALDDGSTDGSAEYLASRPEVIELIRVPPDRPAWDEAGNYRRLVEAALRHGAEWIISVDADERVEREFRERAERVIRRGSLLGRRAYEVRLRELWDTPEQYRADGVWGRKRPGRLFAARADHEFDATPLHGQKCPVQERRNGLYTLADLELYHLRMIDPADRAARRRRYELADPDARHQPDHGYAYLTDERGLRLRRVRPGRGWVE
jgi:hypothetical protein